MISQWIHRVWYFLLINTYYLVSILNKYYHQELSITVSSHLPEKAVKFVENTNDASSISTAVFLNEQEWKLFSYVVPKEKRINDTFKGYYRSGLSVSAFVARKAGYFFNK
jgi:hypothetical protein